MNPSRWNFFMKKLTRDRVVPTISTNVSCEIFGTALTGLSCLPHRASRQSVRASRFSLELNSWSIRSSSIRMFRASICVMNRSDRACCDPCPRGGWCCPTSRSHSPCEGVTRQASFAKEVAGCQHCDDRLSPRLRQHRELHVTLLDVQDALT